MSSITCLEVQLHKPMYLFICNLSIVDIFYTSVTVPKLLHMLLSGNHIVSSAQCYTQLYFFITAASVEETLLFVMAYDRYVAICDPLHYNQILSKRNCIVISFGIWVVAFLNSLLYVTSVLYMSSCHSNIIHQFFCDVKSLTRDTCNVTEMFLIIDGEGFLLFGVVPVICIFTSYFKIFFVVFKIKSEESRSKAFSTCSSHIAVISIYYGTCLAELLIPSHSDILDLSFNIIYTTIVPMTNPIIYSLKNCNVQSAILGLI
ncbi:hypothetical protein GDO81_023906, partial [Engystomops pustulosus]